MVSAGGGVVCMRLIVGSRDSMELKMFFSCLVFLLQGGFWVLVRFPMGFAFSRARSRVRLCSSLAFRLHVAERERANLGRI